MASPGPMVQLISRGTGARSMDRAIKRIEQATKYGTKKKGTDIRDRGNLLKGEPRVRSILHLSTDQSRGQPDRTCIYEGGKIHTPVTRFKPSGRVGADW